MTVPDKFFPRDYRQCSLTVMDNISDPGISFDNDGICNYVHEYRAKESEEVHSGDDGRNLLLAAVDRIKHEGKSNKYDCILGLSGGVDSTYVAHLAHQLGLRVLCVHFDNGWNSELAVKNIENIISQCGFDLFTHVFDWAHFRDLQLSHIRANVVDIEAITDIAIGGTLMMLALEKNIKYILTGTNVRTEAILPQHWCYKDYHNILDIHRRFGSMKQISTFPFLGSRYHRIKSRIRPVKQLAPLNFIAYSKEEAKNTIISQLNWQDYGGKHYESVFTRFYQGYILPNKFGIDKRKAHLSNLIVSGQMSKAAALDELKRPILSPNQLRMDYEFVIKKLGMDAAAFETYILTPRIEHDTFDTDAKYLSRNPGKRFVKKLLALASR